MSQAARWVKQCVTPLFLALALGCSSKESAEPQANDRRADASADDAGDGDAGADGVASAVIGIAGGTLTSLDGRLTITVPEFAVLEDTPFSIGVAEKGDSDVAIGRAYSLTPDDVVFHVPVEVSISYAGELAAGEAAEDLTVLVRDPGQPEWDLALPSEVDEEAQRVTSPRWHFSEYAVGASLDALTARQRRELLRVGETLYVSPSGDDENGGGRLAPLRSLWEACHRVRAGRSYVVVVDGNDENAYDYSGVNQIELAAGDYNHDEIVTCVIDVTGQGSETVIRHSLEMWHGAVLSGVMVKGGYLRLFGGSAFEVEVVGPVSNSAYCVFFLLDGTFANGWIHNCATALRSDPDQLLLRETGITELEVRNSRISDNGVGIQVASGLMTLSGNTIEGNSVGLKLDPGSRVQMADPGGNTISCNTEFDVDSPEGLNARNNIWDHVPPHIVGGDPDGNDSATPLEAGGATRAPDWCGCGNGTVETGETCDDGNEVDNDACSNKCVPTCDDGTLQAGEACDPSAMPVGCMPNFSCNAETCSCECDTVCDDGQVLNPESCSCECETVCDDSQVLNPESCSCECDTVCNDSQVLNPQTCECECDTVCDDGQVLNPQTCECECDTVCDDGQVLNPQTCECSAAGDCGNGALDIGEACDAAATTSVCPGEGVCNPDCTCECALQLSDCETNEALDAESCSCLPLCGNGAFDDLGGESCDLSAGVDCAEPWACSDTCGCECALSSQDCVEPLYFDPLECSCECSLTGADCAVDEALDVESCACVPLCGNGVLEASEACDSSAPGGECGADATCNPTTCECDCGLSVEDCAPNPLDAEACECVAPVCGDGSIDLPEECDDSSGIALCGVGSAVCNPTTCECDCDLLPGSCPAGQEPDMASCACVPIDHCPAEGSFSLTGFFTVAQDFYGHSCCHNVPVGQQTTLVFTNTGGSFDTPGLPGQDLVPLTGTLVNNPTTGCAMTGSGSGPFAGYPNTPCQLLGGKILNGNFTGQLSCSPIAEQPIIFSFPAAMTQP